jgi:8-amino-7-oxononanoate synthase
MSELDDLGLSRRTRLVSGPQGPRVVLDGRPTLVLCSDNYLGLADHPAVREAAADAAMRWGVGAGGSRLAAGTMTIHRRLEERLAAFMGRQSALLFGSGCLARLGVVPALARPGDVVFVDELSHPSLIDACRLSGAETFLYDHLDVEHLAWGVAKSEGRGALIAGESLFALDGERAPLDEIVELGRRRRIRVLVDESHAVGALGPDGRGALAEVGLEDQVDVAVGSLGNSFGSYGGFVACDGEMADYLVNAARTLLFSSAPAPPATAAALAALGLLEERPQLVTKLQLNARALRAELRRHGFELGASQSHIVPIPVGDPELTAEIWRAALSRGVCVEAIRPPAVVGMASSLRLSVMASHRSRELVSAAEALGAAANAAGFDPATAAFEPALDEESGRPGPVRIFDVEQAERLAA